MKLPRWLSPVSAVEAQTGWPRAVCRRFVSRSDEAELERDLSLVYAVTLLLIVSLIALLNWLSAPAPWRGWVLHAAGAILAAILFWAYLRRRLGRLLGAVDDFRAAPWCLDCWRPKSRTAPEVQFGAICPECGEPIPPEIATLAAARGGG